jgi:hypothetical protein
MDKNKPKQPLFGFSEEEEKNWQIEKHEQSLRFHNDLLKKRGANINRDKGWHTKH